MSLPRRPLASLALLALATSPVVAQQGPPDSLVNVQVIPRDTPVQQVIDQMRGITRALGLRCSDCHVSREGGNLWASDFASDEKPMKQKARVMMRMVQAINGEYLTRLADLDAEGLDVTCMTCHRGVSLPQPLSQVLLRAHADGGVTAMDSVYDALRARYYGRAAYDFGEGTLEDVAASLMRRNRPDDAIHAYQRNVDLFGTSASARRSLAGARLATGDTTGAIGDLREALRLNPRDGQSRRALEALGATP